MNKKEGLVMSKSFPEQFKRLLGEIPEKYSLEEWQYLYRDVIFSMGMQILERFSREAIGPNPREEHHGAAGKGTPAGTTVAGDPPGSHGPGINPSPKPGGPRHPNKDGSHGPGINPSAPGGFPCPPQLAGSHGPGYSPSLVIASVALGIQAPPLAPPKVS
jgi:hypothetical protein